MDAVTEKILDQISNQTMGWKHQTSAIAAYKMSLDEAIKSKVSGCTMKARWAKRELEKIGYGVEIVHGYFYAPDRWRLHSWIRVNGEDVDPSHRPHYDVTEKHALRSPDKRLIPWEQIISRSETKERSYRPGQPF